MASYLVTGGCGFIGSHLVDTLLASGHKVVVIDDLSTGYRRNLAPEAELIIGDVCDRSLLLNTLARVDYCFHLAALLGIVSCRENWLGTNRVNLVGTLTVFDAACTIARTTGKKVPIIYTSSCAVYGDTQYLPTPEQSPTIPLSAYGADKLACELHARVATQVHHIPTVGLRLFNVYGPRQNPASIDAGIITAFIDRIAKQAPLVIYGNGEQTRDFVHVSDVVKHLLFFMENIHLAPGIFNVCTGKTSSVKQLVAIINQILGYPIPILYEPPRDGDVMHSQGDPQKTQTLGISATVPLMRGLEDLLTPIKKQQGSRQ